MKQFLKHFAEAMVTINHNAEGHHRMDNHYAPGIGPYGEDQIVGMVMTELAGKYPDVYNDYSVRPGNQAKGNLGLSGYRGLTGGSATPDLVLRNSIMEFKIARPLRDNGSREDTWFKKVFEPNPDSYSTFLDVEKLCLFGERYDRENRFGKWVIVIGFERIGEKDYELDHLFPGLFRYISEEIRGRKIKEFLSHSATLGDRHPFHQVVKLYGFRY